MSVFLLSLVAVAVVFLLGALVVRVVAAIPLEVLGHAEEEGRYAWLVSDEGPSPAAPAAGPRVASLVTAKGYGY
jgi:hypothetical protein